MSEHEDNQGTFVVYNPESTLPITQEYKSRKQACKVADIMAAKFPGQIFKVMQEVYSVSHVNVKIVDQKEELND